MPRIHEFSAKHLFNPTRMDDLIKLLWTVSKARKLTGQTELGAFIKVFRSKRTCVAQALSPVKQAASAHSFAGSLGDNLETVGALTMNRAAGGIIAGQIKRYIDGN